MNNVTSVLAQAKALSKQEQQELLTQLEEYLVLGSQVAQVTKEVKEMRFSKGRVCCHCNGTDVVRNGKNKGVQRYLCRNCHHSFSDLTNSATYKSKKTLDKWLRYAKCMLNGYSIRKSAEIVEINIATSFLLIHIKELNFQICQDLLAIEVKKLKSVVLVKNKFVLQLLFIGKVI